MYWQTNLANNCTTVSTLHAPSHLVSVVHWPVGALELEYTRFRGIPWAGIVGGTPFYNDA